jgi:hypothetical protein
MTRRWLVCSIMVAFAFTAQAAQAETNASDAQMEIDISAMAPDRPPQDFDVARTGRGDPARWIVVQDPTAAGGRAIAQTSRDRTDYRFPLALYRPFSAQNVEVTVRFKPVAGDVDQAGGIVVRASGPDNYYIVRANALEDNVRFYRVVGGQRIQISNANVRVAPGAWHTLTLRAQGDRFSVSYDGKQLYTVRDQTFADVGKVGLWTKADSVTHFDRISIMKLP